MHSEERSEGDAQATSAKHHNNIVRVSPFKFQEADIEGVYNHGQSSNCTTGKCMEKKH